MIVSFHPLFEADTNIICAGRDPNAEDLSAIKAADAVVLSQGCSQPLYDMARSNCSHVFPNYNVRFEYPGKTGQIKLFRNIDVSHPASKIFADVAAFHRQQTENHLPFTFPLVFKLDWGGEGQTVYRINTAENLQQILKQTAEFEKSGQSGFLLQEYIASVGKTLRIVSIGQQYISYWRIQENSAEFYSNLNKGAVINKDAEPESQHKAVDLVTRVCQKTGINLAGFDVIFASQANPVPLLLEINYFFGRKGLGGSEAYYKILLQEIHKWLKQRDLS